MDRERKARSQTNSVSRALHDLGLAAWFGGSLMGAVGLNAASAEVSDLRDRTRVANAGWGRWQPVNALAIGAYVVGSLGLVRGNKARMATQRGVASASGIKAALSAMAAGASAYAGVLGQRIMKEEARARAEAGTGVPTESGTTPSPETPEEVAKAQEQEKRFQWLVPALTGALLVVNARMGEQERPTEVAKGLLGRVKPDRG